MGYLRSGYEGSEGHWGPVWRVRSEGHLEVNLRSILGISGPYSRPYLRNLIE